MTSEEIIEKGKEILRNEGVVESEVTHKDTQLRPSVPGLGSMGSSATFRRNRSSLEKYFIKNKLIGDNFAPETATEVLGQDISMPVFSAPMSGIRSNLKGLIEEEDLLSKIMSGCRQAGTYGMGGDSFDSTAHYVIPGLVKTIGGIGVCKPRTFDLLKERILQLAQAGAPAIGIDLDGIARMLINTNEVGRKSMAELKELRTLFDGPMFLKGILSVEDAILAHEAGYDAIVVSNHGGRTVDYCLGTADILPEIARELKGKVQILVDGGVKSGYDVFVYLALGADAVLAGRTLLYSAIGGGKDGVALTLSKIQDQLRATMLYAGCETIRDITSENIGRYEA